MSTLRKSFLVLAGLGASLLLSACGTQLPEARAAFGYSGLQANQSELTNYEQGKADFAARRYGLAVKRFEMAMAEAPASVEAVNGLAASYDQIGRFDLAERYYRRALSMEPNSAQTLNNLGYSMLLQGKHDLAMALFSDAIRQAPENETVAANGDMAVAALMKDRQKRAASETLTQTSPSASQQLAAAAERAEDAARIVRVNPSLQRLELAAKAEPKSGGAVEESLLVPAVYGGPATPPPSLPHVDVQLLPAVLRPQDRIHATEIEVSLPTVRVAEPQSGSNLVIAVAQPETAPSLADLAGSVEVANGTGRRRMAARMKAHLVTAGLSAAWLTNAGHFTHATTTVTYRPSHRQLAEAISSSLPIAPQLQEVTEQAADVRIELGGDLLEFDRGLLQAERNLTHDGTA